MKPKKKSDLLRHSGKTVFALLFILVVIPLTAQKLKITIPPSEFRVFKTKPGATIESVSDGLRVKAGPAEKITIVANIKRPDPAMAEPLVQGIVVHFYSDQYRGGYLSKVWVPAGQNKAFEEETRLAGDYTVKERANGNAWYWDNNAVRVYDKTLIAIEIYFSVGAVGPTFTLTGVDLYFPRANVYQAGAGNESVVGSNVLKKTEDQYKESIIPPVSSSGNAIYALTDNNELKWYKHNGRKDGTYAWSDKSGAMVKSGWNFKHLFSGGGGVIYAIDEAGDLYWYLHTGEADGTNNWAPKSGSKVGNGWNFKQVFSGGGGVIYAVDNAGDLWWYYHTGFGNGANSWDARSGSKIGNGWNFKQVFSGGHGLIYGITDAGDLLWYQHHGFADGTNNWARDSGNRVGNGWHFKHVFSGGGGLIYAIDIADDLRWYNHNGLLDGSYDWTEGTGNKVGNGWYFKMVF